MTAKSPSDSPRDVDRGEMVKFLHTADWQIGMRAAHVGAVGGRVRGERLQAARRVVTVANENAAEFLIVAGDTFEDNAVDRLLVQQVADILAGFRGPVFLIPGNHDPLVPGSVWEHASWKSHANLRVLTADEPVEVAGVTLYPCPLHEKYSPRDPTRWIDARDDSRVAIGIAHGTVEGVAHGELDYPIPRDAADRAGLDYLGLGHWHSFASYPPPGGSPFGGSSAGAGGTSALGSWDGGASRAESSRAESSRLAYSGTHETTKFGERDSGNALLVEIPARGEMPRLTPIRTGGLTWRVIERGLADDGDAARLRQELEAIGAADTTLLDVRLRGVLGRDDESELRRMEELLQARFLFGRLDASGAVPRPDDDRWLDELPAGVIRETARQIRSWSDPGWVEGRPEAASPEVATRALLELYRMQREAGE